MDIIFIQGLFCVFSIIALTFLHVKEKYPEAVWKATMLDVLNLIMFTIALVTMSKTSVDLFTNGEETGKFKEVFNAPELEKGRKEWASATALAGIEM